MAKPGNNGAPRRFAIEIVRLDGRRKTVTYTHEAPARKRYEEFRSYRVGGEPDQSMFARLELVDRALNQPLEKCGRDIGRA